MVVTANAKAAKQRRKGALNFSVILPYPPRSSLWLGEVARQSRAFAPLILILVVAILLRTFNLHYSEFQGDEALTMLAAAEALEGHENALFLRSKGPAEVLLPMALWRLSGAINEATARLPFTVAATLAMVAIYLLGEKLGGRRTGWLGAGFFAGNGFMVAFGRIVQYQALVVWFSALALLLLAEWQQARKLSLVGLSGLCLGFGLLAHYDAILVAPALAWLLLSGEMSAGTAAAGKIAPKMGAVRPASRAVLRPVLLFGAVATVTALTFYLPYALDPQANRTGDYLGGRIGTELRNNLPDFFHFTTFYSSFYYLILTMILVFGVLIYWLHHTRWGRWWLPALALGGLLSAVFAPNWLTTSSVNLTFLPFALTFLAALVALFFHPQAAPGCQPSPPYALPVLIWLAVPFLGYNFVVALGLTHIYTIVPAWSLLAALGWDHLLGWLQIPITPSRLLASGLVLGALFTLSTIFLGNAFIRHDIEYWQDYPAGKLSFFWDPYDQPPQAGFFGFAHRTGWKAVGQKIASGELSGDYGSNEEPDITTWYTRGAPRACDPQPEFYYLASDLIDPVAVPNEVLATAYLQIGRVALPNQKQMHIMQLKPSSLTIGELDEAMLAYEFDQTAIPAAFARSTRGTVPVEANFGRLVRLIGYDLDTRRAYPGGRVPVTLYWQALSPIPISYQVFTHLEGSSGPVAQADGAPACWSYPTDRWRPGQIVADQHAMYLPPQLLPGSYPLQIGLYQADTFERLDVLDAAGNPVGTSVTLTQVTIR
jgi:hypothetical protein